jgi:hypothetical protein
VRYFTGICLKRTTKITKNVVRIIGLEAENWITDLQNMMECSPRNIEAHTFIKFRYEARNWITMACTISFWAGKSSYRR